MDAAEEGVLFFHELGLAVGEWASVESALWSIVATLIGKNDRTALWFGFFAIENFRAKLSFADAFLARKIADQKLRIEWTALAKKMNKTGAHEKSSSPQSCVCLSSQRRGQTTSSCRMAQRLAVSA